MSKENYNNTKIMQDEGTQVEFIINGSENSGEIVDKNKECHKKAQKHLESINEHMDQLFEKDEDSSELELLTKKVDEINKLAEYVRLSTDPIYTMHKAINNILSDNIDHSIKETAIVQLLENFYTRKILTEHYTLDYHEEVFHDALLYAKNNTSEGEIKTFLGNIYDYTSI